MHVGLRDKLGAQRRELWLEFEGKPLLYGWCSSHVLATREPSSVWHPEKPFGTFLVLGKK